MYRQYFETDRVPLTQNQMLRMHWAERRRDAKWWATWLRLKGRPQAMRRRCHVKIHVRRWNLQDPDNLAASVKHVLDGLVKADWLVDDSPKWVKLEVTEEMDRRRKANAHRGTEIVVEEI